MNRNWRRRSKSGLPILSAVLLSAGSLMWNGMWSSAAAQSYSGASNEVVVNYDVLNALPGQAAPYGAQGAQAGTPPNRSSCRAMRPTAMHPAAMA